MLDVFFTIDVEIWCDGWADLDRKFPDCFRRYVHGADGRHGLRDQLRMLGDRGLRAVCFVEPLFASRFGREPLDEVVGLIREAGHEVQLHLHTEWVDEARQPLLPNVTAKRQHLRHFSVDEQTTLIALGADWIERASGKRPSAFRAGSFAFNADTLTALERVGIFIDSSYNASTFGPSSGVWPGDRLLEPAQCGAVLELPMTVYAQGGDSLRHAQLTACSFAELQALLWQAVESESPAFVMLSHNFELLSPSLSRPDPVVVRRLERLCALLDRHRDVFRVRGFDDAPLPRPRAEQRLLSSPAWRTSLRHLEQLYRRRYR